MNRIPKKSRDAIATNTADTNADVGRTTGRPWFSVTIAFMTRYATLPSATIGGFVRLACACAVRLSGGVLVGAADWNARQWLLIANIERSEADDVVTQGLAHWNGSDLVLSDYDGRNETKYIGQRARAATARGAKKSAPAAVNDRHQPLKSGVDVNGRHQPLRSGVDVEGDHRPKTIDHRPKTETEERGRDSVPPPHPHSRFEPSVRSLDSVQGERDSDQSTSSASLTGGPTPHFAGPPPARRLRAGDLVALKARHHERFTKHGAYAVADIVRVRVRAVHAVGETPEAEIETLAGEGLGRVPLTWIVERSAA
jgi:hypothetical protein